MSRRPRVAVVHPWFPQYREPFFEQLLELASSAGVDIDIFHGQVPPEWRDRGDSLERPQLATSLPTRWLRVGRRIVVAKSLRPVLARGKYDLYVFEHAVRNLETLVFIATHRRGRIAFWGHGRSYTSQSSAAQEWFKNLINRRATWFFSYTEGGRRSVVRGGFPPDRVTVVNNSIDTAALKTEIEGLSSADIESFRRETNSGSQCVLYMGGLDASKRLDFLIEACARIAKRNPEFSLLVAGNGDEAAKVRAASTELEWLNYLGPVSGRRKALALEASSCIVMPGRVGLIAVDSLAAGRPIVTTDWALHAPEFEYLTQDKTCLVTGNSIDAYADEIGKLLSNSERLSDMQEACKTASENFSISKMAENFMSGVSQAVRVRYE